MGTAEREATSRRGAGDVRTNAAEEALFAAINRARKTKRLPALRISAPLAHAARAHSADLRATSRCSHEGSDGSSLQDRLAAVGVVPARYGEVVACGSASAKAAVEQWLDSDAHRDILLGRAFKSVGVGVALGAEVSDARWTAVLGAP